MQIHSLRDIREAMGLTATQLADVADCPVEVLLRAEFGVTLPVGEAVRGRLAHAYRLNRREYLRLALDAAEHATRALGL